MAFTNSTILQSIWSGLFCCLGLSGPVTAHELWLQPDKAQVQVGDLTAVRVMVGTDFVGEELANLPNLQEIVDLYADGARFGLQSRIGDMPAFKFQAQGDGLIVLRYQSVVNFLKYDSFEKFSTFTKEARRPDLLDEVARRNLAHDDIRELFTRYAKALIGIGDSAGEDVVIGMPFELIATNNPYLAAGGKVRYRLLTEGQPAAKTPVHVFIRDDDAKVTRLDLQTDASGQVDVPTDLPGFYLVSAIRVEPTTEAQQKDFGAFWQSLWASSTFAIKG